MKFIAPIIAALFSLFLISCEKLNRNKSFETTVKGQVRTYGTEEAVKGVPVSVMLWKLVDEVNHGFTMVDSVRTDAQGWYTISQKLEEDEKYYLSVTGYSGKLYAETQWLSVSFSRRAAVMPGGSQIIHLYPVAYGYVNFHFVNMDPHPSDRFAYNLGGGAFEELYGVISIYRLWDFGGNLSHPIAIGTTENGIDTSWKQYFIPPAFDTLQLQIEF